MEIIKIVDFEEFRYRISGADPRYVKRGGPEIQKGGGQVADITPK